MIQISCFEEIFNANTIAVIGASQDPNKLGYKIVENLVAQQRKVYPINPSITHVLNLKAYASVKDVPEPITLAILIISPKRILQAITDCGIKGIKYAIIISEGFQETGPEGAQLQETLKKLLDKYKIRAIGPNTMGIHDTVTPFTASFLDSMRNLKPGSVSISSQTGILAGALLQYLNLTKNIGIARVIDLGNKIDLDHGDVLEFFMNDKNTKVIGMHIEGVSNGQKFAQRLKEASLRKPVVILKGGVMDETKRIVASHTGSIAGDEKIFDSLVRKSGAIRVIDFPEFADVLKGFSYMPCPEGNEVAIITGSGGAAVITIDALLRNGLKLAKLSKNTIEEIRRFIPEEGKIQNPIDIWPSAVRYGIDTLFARMIALLNDDPNVKAIITLLFKVEDFSYDFDPIIQAALSCSKPIFFAIQGTDTENIRNTFESKGLPTFSYGEKITRILYYMWNYKKFLKNSRNSINNS